MKRLLLLGAILLTGGAIAETIHRHETSTPARAEGAESLIQVAAARPATPPEIKATGVIKARVGAEVRVGARISGVVNSLHVKVGDTVRKGDLLATLDDRDLCARRAEADATLLRARAELTYAEADLRRKRDLHAAGAIAPSDLDLAERACTVAQQQVAVAEAALNYACIQLDYTRIIAPISGVVASVATQEGETVAASFAAPTFVTLIDLSRLEVWAYVDETDIGRIEAGLPARFTVDTYADEEFAGVVTTIYPKAEIRDNVVNYITVVRFESVAERILRPEMTTTVRIAREPLAAGDDQALSRKAPTGTVATAPLVARAGERQETAAPDTFTP